MRLQVIMIDCLFALKQYHLIFFAKLERPVLDPTADQQYLCLVPRRLLTESYEKSQLEGKLGLFNEPYLWVNWTAPEDYFKNPSRYDFKQTLIGLPTASWAYRIPRLSLALPETNRIKEELILGTDPTEKAKEFYGSEMTIELRNQNGDLYSADIRRLELQVAVGGRIKIEFLDIDDNLVLTRALESQYGLDQRKTLNTLTWS